MTEEELQNSMYNTKCDLEKVDDDLLYLIEVLRCRSDEIGRIKEDIKEDRILYKGLDNVQYNLENCTDTLDNMLTVFRDRRSRAEEYARICTRLVKGGIEK